MRHDAALRCYARDELAAGCVPDRTPLVAGVQALDSVRMTETCVHRALLDAANELHLVLDGATSISRRTVERV